MEALNQNAKGLGTNPKKYEVNAFPLKLNEGPFGEVGFPLAR